MQTSEQKLKYLKKTIDVLWHGVEDTKDGDYPRIINLYKEVLKLDYKDADSWENMIWLMWSLSINKKDKSYLLEAEKMAKRYLSLNNKGYRSYEYLGMFYRVMKPDLKLSARYYESAIRFKDAKPTTYHSLLSVYEKLGDKIKALDYKKQGLNKFPNDPYLKIKNP
jgi:tetratricopeptide (TPR) repeat protein